MSAREQYKALERRKTDVTLQIVMGDKTPGLKGLLADIKADLAALAPLVRAERYDSGDLSPDSRLLREIFGKNEKEQL